MLRKIKRLFLRLPEQEHIHLHMNYTEAIEYIESFINFEKIPKYSYASSFRLERMHAFLKALGGPHHGLRTLHIAGSKGKGSTCCIMSSILKEAGYRVGLYTSPHLLDVRERIKVFGEGVIGKDRFIELIERIKPVSERFRDHKSLGKLSFFEVLTACAFLYFKEEKVDLVILETGLGGRLDATNVTGPILCGITNISMEHTDKLGDSLGEIAKEKAGIIKGEIDGVRSPEAVFTAPQKKEVMEVLRGVCKEKRTPLHEIGSYTIIESNSTHQAFHLDGEGYSYKNLRLDLLGHHQVENAALAIAMLRFIDRPSLKIEEDALRRGLKDISWPGRLQVIQREPYVILDGAQNVASIKAVLSSISRIFSYKRLICIFGISSDKEIKGVSRELDDASDIVILTRSRNERAKEPIYLRGNFSKRNPELTHTVEAGLRSGLDAAKREDLILVTGSFYVVGEAMSFFKPATKHGEVFGKSKKQIFLEERTKVWAA